MLYEYEGNVLVGAKPQDEGHQAPPTTGWIVRGKLTLQRVYGYMVSMKMIKKKQLLIENFSADLLHLRCVLLLPVQHLFDTQGALLPAALNAHPRTWTCSIAILDVGFH